MKIINSDPPNWEKIQEHFPTVDKNKVFVTYGDCIYTHHLIVPQEIYDHECLHKEQQDEIGVENWWEQYYKDPMFRYSQELPAYRIQIKSWAKRNKDRNALNKYRIEIAQLLSGALYGKCVAYDVAFKALL